MLRAPSYMLSKLYDGNPKVIILATDSIQISAGDLLDHYVFQLTEGGHFALQENEDPSGAGVLSLDLPPSNVWAFWVPGSISDTSLEQLKTWCSDTGSKDFDAPIIKGGRDALVEGLLARSRQEVQKLANANVALMRDLAALRESWVSHVRIPAAVQELLTNLRLASPRLIFNNSEASNDRAISVGPFDPSCITQSLPVGARGLLGFDLNVTNVGTGQGILFTQLLARDTGAVLAKGQIPFDTLCPGWLPFRLQSASAAASHAVELHVWTESESGATPPQIGVVSPGLLSKFGLNHTAEVAGSSKGPQMLALRLWGGLPGIEIFTLSGELLNQPLAAFAMPVPDSLLKSVTLTRELAAPYPVFGYMEHGKVLLRPLKALPSAAVIRLPAIRGLVEISCEAFIDDRRCETRGLGARIVVTSKGISADQAEKGEGVLAATDWTELNEPLTVSKLMVRFTDVQNEPVDMHLFTRLPKPGTVPPYGRIVFKQFVTEVHAGSAWDMPPIMLRESRVEVKSESP
ncbi:DUF6212 domain-containing protein [Phyllobacterium sp. K27]